MHTRVCMCTSPQRILAPMFQRRLSLSFSRSLPFSIFFYSNSRSRCISTFYDEPTLSSLPLLCAHLLKVLLSTSPFLCFLIVLERNFVVFLLASRPRALPSFNHTCRTATYSYFARGQKKTLLKTLWNFALRSLERWRKIISIRC